MRLDRPLTKFRLKRDSNCRLIDFFDHNLLSESKSKKKFQKVRNQSILIENISKMVKNKRIFD